MKLPRHSAKFNDDGGSVAIEFIVLGVMVQLLLLLFGARLIEAQHDRLAAESMVRNGLRAYTLTGKVPTQTAAEIANAYGIPDSKITVASSCGGGDCSADGAWVSLFVAVGTSSATGVAQK